METDHHQKGTTNKALQPTTDCDLSDCSCFAVASLELKTKKKCCKKYKKKGKNCKKCPRLMMN